jgi:hypothetical protein
MILLSVLSIQHFPRIFRRCLCNNHTIIFWATVDFFNETITIQKILPFCLYSIHYETVLTLYLNGRLESVFFLHSLIFWSRSLWSHAHARLRSAPWHLVQYWTHRGRKSETGSDRRLAQLSWRRGGGGCMDSPLMDAAQGSI